MILIHHAIAVIVRGDKLGHILHKLFFDKRHVRCADEYIVLLRIGKDLINTLQRTDVRMLVIYDLQPQILISSLSCIRNKHLRKTRKFFTDAVNKPSRFHLQKGLILPHPRTLAPGQHADAQGTRIYARLHNLLLSNCHQIIS